MVTSTASGLVGVAGGAVVSAIFAADDCRLASAELARELAKVVAR